MQAERWKNIEELYQAAIALSAEKRADYLAQACPGDPDLRAEVQSLLAQQADSFLESSPLSAIKTLSPGAKLGNFEIVELIGRGGMGEVYRARDSRLKRDVAIKVLPAGLARDPDRIARFEREARAAGGLNHPNIVSVYEIGREDNTYWIATELVAGESLAKVIERGPLRVPKALEIATQVADGLAAAHAAGIVHRDLKPANLMVTRDGRVKILDFGLALRQRTSQDSTTMDMTDEGTILGTAGYMSPEQVRGETVDHRSDLFSFGVVLHEMCSGKRAFSGTSSVEVMNAVLKDQPAELPASVPAALALIVRRCLEKEPVRRFQSAADLAFALQTSSPALPPAAMPAIGDARIAPEEADGVVPDAAETPLRAAGKRWPVLALLSVAVLLAGLSAALYLTRPSQLDLSTYKFTPVATDTEPEDFSSWSPDGNSIAYLKNIDGWNQVMVRNLNAPSATQLTRLPSGVYGSAPFFSRDGEQIYFIARGLWAVAVVGGEPREVLSPPDAGGILAATLSPDAKTLALWLGYPEEGKRHRSLFISSPPGAPPRKYEPAPFREEGSYIPNYLRFSPDGSQIVLSSNPTLDEAWIWSIPWPGGPRVRPRRIFGGELPQWTPDFDWMPDSRHICLSYKGNLSLADTRTGKIQQLTASPIGSADHPSVSPDGKQVVFTTGVEDYDIVEVPLDGSPPRPLVATAQSEKSPSWSAVGDEMAFITDRSGESEIWLRSSDGHWARPVVRQSDFPDDPKGVFDSVSLSPDGTRVACIRGGRLRVSPVSGGKASEVVAGGKEEFGGPSWSPDGSSLVYMAAVGGAYKLAVARVGSRQPLFLVPATLPQCRSAPAWSPDGRWIACGGPGKTVLLVSPDGAQQRSLPSPVDSFYDRFVLVWSRDAATIFVASSLAGRSRLDAIDVRRGNIRGIAEYTRDVIFSDGNAYTLGGSLTRDGKSFATTVLNHKADLWMLEGFPQPARPWF
jgi:serine/threonine protein kinase